MDFGVNVTSSVFDSRFLEFEYLGFLDQIGYVPGMAAHVSSAFGPLSLIAEWNGAVSSATFEDDLGETINITPGAWQVSMGYQFDWNPSVIEVGAQGTYFAIGYSESYGLGGVTRLIDLNPFHPPAPEEVRSGSYPKSDSSWAWVNGYWMDFESLSNTPTSWTIQSVKDSAQGVPPTVFSEWLPTSDNLSQLTELP